MVDGRPGLSEELMIALVLLRTLLAVRESGERAVALLLRLVDDEVDWCALWPLLLHVDLIPLQKGH